MRRFVGLTALAIIVAMAVLPAAASATSFTVGGAQTFTGPVSLPCTGESGTVTATGNGVFHFNFNKAGDGWFTSTLTGTFTFVAFSPGTVNYAGTVTAWFGFNFNLKNFAGTDILDSRARGVTAPPLAATC